MTHLYHFFKIRMTRTNLVFCLRAILVKIKMSGDIFQRVKSANFAKTVSKKDFKKRGEEKSSKKETS